MSGHSIRRPAALAVAVALAATATVATARAAGTPTAAPPFVVTGTPRVVTGDTGRVLGVQAQPCAIRQAANGQALPDPICTPGVTASRVRQSNIQRTICRSGYTATVRPPQSVTGRLRVAAAKVYGTTLTATTEYDHLIPLELGGANDVANLWPEPATSATQASRTNQKDAVEHALHAQVCAGRLTLAAAQTKIAADWTTAR